MALCARILAGISLEQPGKAWQGLELAWRSLARPGISLAQPGVAWRGLESAWRSLA